MDNVIKLMNGLGAVLLSYIKKYKDSIGKDGGLLDEDAAELGVRQMGLKF